MADINLDAHYTDNMKVTRPVVQPVDVSAAMINKTKIFNYQETDKKMKDIYTDIYEGARKERAEHGFNKKLFFKICGGITLLTIFGTIIHRCRK